ncbi:hypothetical protein NP493_122g01008 [Ridgeia piscesae]|uniref:Uncharacterized protein n=1 Tax=Ridgeia piscesae TaxID=27915 RepID=A0AAD9P6G4_RIDPI|nr:hypothetical protein NP493_122g01008 [Ridgeia piscesae]
MVVVVGWLRETAMDMMTTPRMMTRAKRMHSRSDRRCQKPELALRTTTGLNGPPVGVVPPGDTVSSSSKLVRLYLWPDICNRKASLSSPTLTG